jgi:uncharacterized glyoxalase superfamily protein PhnB
MQHLAMISLLVRDDDEAIAFYCKKLHFQLLEDTRLTDTKRWVVLAPGAETGCKILLAKAANPEQSRFVGNQSGRRVFLFLHTDDFDDMHQNLLSNQIKIMKPPALETYGKRLVFEDLYGNLWDLIGPLPDQ